MTPRESAYDRAMTVADGPASRVRVHNFSVSLDRFGTGEGQSLEAPFGHADHRLLEWALPTRTFQERGFHDAQSPTVGVDEAFASRWNTGVGVEIMGRKKFAPSRGPWDERWRGWWGDDQPFHTPVVVLTHHPRPPLVMAVTNRKAMLMVEMMKKVRVVRMLVQIRGMVMRKNCVSRPAPSRLALSYRLARTEDIYDM